MRIKRKSSSSLPGEDQDAVIMQPDIQRIFDSAPGCFLVLAPDGPLFTIIAVTDSYLQATKTRRNEILGKGVFEVFPDNPEDPTTRAVDSARASFQRVVDHRRVDVMGVRRHDIRHPESEGGGFVARFWNAVNSPVFGADGQVTCIIHRVEEVTESMLLKQKEAEERASNISLRDSRAAALNLMRDAVAARQQAEQANEKLRREISERKRAEEEIQRLLSSIQEEKDRLSSLLNSIRDEVWFADTNRNFTLANPAAVREFNLIPANGLEVEKFAESLEVYRSDGSLRPVEESPPLRALNGEIIKAEEEIIRTPGTGELRNRQVSAAPVRDAQGNIIGSVSVVRDITEKKRAEEELRLSEEKFAAAFSNNPAAIALTRFEDGIFIDVNDTWVELMGYSRDEIIGLSSRKLNIWPTSDAAARFVGELREKGYLHGWEQEFHKKSGEVFIAQLSAQILTLHGEKMILSTLIDITERKRAEEALREAQLRTSSILEGIADTFYSLDENWRFTVVNPAAERAPFGRPASELLGRVIWEIYPNLVGTPIQQHYLDAAEKRSMEHYEALSPLNGRWYEVFMQGQKGGVDVYMRDITDRKLAEENLQTTLQRFYLILSNMYSGILLVNNEDRIEFANQAFCDMFGLTGSSSDLMKLSAKEMIEKIRPSYLFPVEAVARISEIVSLGEPVKGEEVALSGGRTVLRNFIPIRLGEKQYGRLWIHIDITERKRSEIALLATYDNLQIQSEELQAVNEELQAQSEELQTQSEELQAQSEELHSVNEELLTLNKNLRETRDYLDKLLNYANAPVIVWDPDMRITLFNRAFEKLTGYYAKEVIGRELDMLFPPESREKSLENIDRASTGEYWETVEIPILREDGDVRIALWNSANILAEDGTLIATIAQGQDITHRRQAEEALKESEERYRSLFNSMTEGFALHEIICDDKGVPIDYRFLDINPAFEKLTGLKREMVVGKTHNETLPGDSPKWVEEYGRVALTGEPIHLENYSPPLKKHFEVFAYRPMLNKFAVLFMDITERKKAEERIAKLTRLYQMLSRANEAIVRTEDEESLFSEVCRIVAEAGGFPLVWIGMVKEQQVIPAVWCGAASDYLKEIKVEIDGELGKGPTGTSIRENRSVVNDDFTTQDNSAPWRKPATQYGLSASASFPLHRQGRVIGALSLYSSEPKAFDKEQVSLLESLSSDLSYALDTFEHENRRMEAEEALRETKDYLDKLLNYANAPVIVWDPNMRVTLFNHAFEKLTGYSSEEVIGRELSMIFSQESRNQSLESIARASKGEYLETVEIPIKRKDGEVRIALWNSANITSSDGVTLAATIAQGQDITERKKAEEKLIATNKELEQFAYVASHDLQEPLRAIISFTQLLARRYKGHIDERADEYIEFIVDGSTRMQQLIQDLLSFSRAGRLNIERSLIDSNTIVDRIIVNTKESNNPPGAEITHDSLPVLYVNETSLTQVFQNLIGNALKFHKEGEPPRVHVSVQKREGEWLFSVKDNGIGISEKYFEKLFVIFQRLHGKQEYPGTGIGLAICKKIVESYGGRIWVESVEGEGSTFYFTLPV